MHNCTWNKHDYSRDTIGLRHGPHLAHRPFCSAAAAITTRQPRTTMNTVEQQICTTKLNWNYTIFCNDNLCRKIQDTSHTVLTLMHHITDDVIVAYIRFCGIPRCYISSNRYHYMNNVNQHRLGDDRSDRCALIQNAIRNIDMASFGRIVRAAFVFIWHWIGGVPNSYWR